MSMVVRMEIPTSAVTSVPPFTMKLFFHGECARRSRNRSMAYRRMAAWAFALSVPMRFLM